MSELHVIYWFKLPKYITKTWHWSFQHRNKCTLFMKRNWPFYLLQKKVSRVGVGDVVQVGQPIHPVDQSNNTTNQWWKQHPSHHQHQPNHFHQNGHHQGNYAAQSHSHNNPVTTVRQSCMQVCIKTIKSIFLLMAK